MVLKLLKDASKTRNPEYQYVTFESLAILQKDFAEEKFATFKKNRARVIEHLTDASWITIRGCRFGQGTEAMYALYAFFGGRANVYAPRYYQFFGSQEIGWEGGEDAKKRGRPIGERPPRKFDNRLDAHEHLVRQRFFPKHLHTDDRKDAVVQFLVDPGMYSETIELGSATNPASDSAYAKLIVDLDATRIPATVTTKLAEADHVLTERGKVKVIRAHSGRWRRRARVDRIPDYRDRRWRLSHRGRGLVAVARRCCAGLRGLSRGPCALIRPAAERACADRDPYDESEGDDGSDPRAGWNRTPRHGLGQRALPLVRGLGR